MSNPVTLRLEKMEVKDKAYLRQINRIVDKAARKSAEHTAKRTISLAPKGSKWRSGKWGNDAGPLSMEIDVAKGKYPTGDYQIQAQGPGNYTKFYAIFVELGSSIVPYRNVPRGTSHPGKIHIPKRPYLRPALKQTKRVSTRIVQAMLD